MAKKRIGCLGCFGVLAGAFLLLLVITAISDHNQPAGRHPQGASSTQSPTRRAESSIPYRVIASEDNPPHWYSYSVRVDFIGGRLPTDAELAAVSREVKSKSPSANKTFVLFFMPGEDVESGAWATAHHTPDLTVDIVRRPEPPDVEAQEKLGLSLNIASDSTLRHFRLRIVVMPWQSRRLQNTTS